MTRSSEPWFKTSSIVGNGGTFVAGLQFNGWNFADIEIQSGHTQSSVTTSTLAQTSDSSIRPSGTSFVSPASQNTDASKSNVSKDSNGMSTSATIKIIAGTSAGILSICIFLLAFFLIRRKKRKQIVEEHRLQGGRNSVESRNSFKSARPLVTVPRQETVTSKHSTLHEMCAGFRDIAFRENRI